MSESSETQKVHVLLVDGSSDWEPAYAIAGINQPAFQRRPGRYATAIVARTRDPIRTMGGMTILPDMALAAVDPRNSAMLIMVGGTAWDAGEQPEAVAKAAEFLAAGTPVAAICGATLGLARGGLLNDRPHTSNAREYLDGAPGYRGGDHYVDEPVVRDGDLITASAMAPIDFARAIFERLDVYAPAVLDAWYRLYAHADAAGYHELVAQGAESANPDA